jgi:hypothetical protein
MQTKAFLIMLNILNCFSPVMSVKGVNFGHMSRMKLPSVAAVASKNWSNYSDFVEIPSLDLMERMQQGGGAQIIFLSFKGIQELLPPPENIQDFPHR